MSSDSPVTSTVQQQTSDHDELAEWGDEIVYDFEDTWSSTSDKADDSVGSYLDSLNDAHDLAESRKVVDVSVRLGKMYARGHGTYLDPHLAMRF